MSTQANDAAAGGGTDITAMSDPDFLAERRRAREALAGMSPQDPRYPELDAESDRLDEEFLRRASLAWQPVR
jgi:hypothetical protein